MLPEISRRCLSCGASVRAGARFCPQCGNSLDEEGGARGVGTGGSAGEGAEAGAQESASVEAPRTRDAEAQDDWVKPTGEFAAFVQSLEESRADAPARDGARSEAPPAATAPDARGVAEGSTAAQSAPPAPDAASAAAVPVSEQVAAGQPTPEAFEDKRGRVARVREGTKARAVKMRDDALVALEETPDDSGLRFVVVAAVLFALFIFFLFLSTTVLR